MTTRTASAPTGDVALVLGLAAGLPVDEAAAAAGMSRATAYRRLDDPAFSRAVREERARIMHRATGRLADLALAAADTLGGLMTDSTTTARDRIAAARAILEAAPRL